MTGKAVAEFWSRVSTLSVVFRSSIFRSCIFSRSSAYSFGSLSALLVENLNATKKLHYTRNRRSVL